jgi:hypothetical protein
MEKIKVWNWCYSTWAYGKDKSSASQFASSAKLSWVVVW